MDLEEHLIGSASWLHYTQEVQDDEDDGDDDQKMDPAAGFRELWAYVSTKEAKKPQHDQDHDDCPQHGYAPFEKLVGCRLSTICQG